MNQASHLGDTTLYKACVNGHDKVVKLLLKKDDIQVNQANWIGDTPLVVAANSRQGKIVEMLLRTHEIRNIGWDGWRPHRRRAATPNLPSGRGGPRSVPYTS